MVGICRYCSRTRKYAKDCWDKGQVFVQHQVRPRAGSLSPAETDIIRTLEQTPDLTPDEDLRMRRTASAPAVPPGSPLLAYSSVLFPTRAAAASPQRDILSPSLRIISRSGTTPTTEHSDRKSTLRQSVQGIDAPTLLFKSSSSSSTLTMQADKKRP